MGHTGCYLITHGENRLIIAGKRSKLISEDGTVHYY